MDIERQGAAVYQQYNCVACHQFYGLGGYMGPDLTNVISNRGAAYARAFITAGTGTMPNLGLAPEEIDRVVAYGDAEFIFNQVTATGDRLVIDVVKATCLAIGEGRNVHIVYPGSLFKARRLEINYRSMDLKSWHGNHEIGSLIRSR